MAVHVAEPAGGEDEGADGEGVGGDRPGFLGGVGRAEGRGDDLERDDDLAEAGLSELSAWASAGRSSTVFRRPTLTY